MTGQISQAQYEVLARPLNATRVAKRSGGGKQLSYLEAWDVRAHLTRIFGYGSFDAEMLEAEHMFTREYMGGSSKDVPSFEIAYRVMFRLTIRDQFGEQIATYVEGAVGSASGSVGIGDLHDNALKTAASDALKRCATNLGNQFGLSLYDKGNVRDIIKGTVTLPAGVEAMKKEDATEAQKKVLEASLGAVEIDGDGNEIPKDES